MDQVLKSAKNKLQLFYESKRLETFTNWKFKNNDSCSALKMAEAGFHYTGKSVKSDAVQCFLCDKELDGWDKTDDPWSEHISHSPQCAFAKLGQPEESLTQSQLIDFKILLTMKSVIAEVNKILEEKDKEKSKQLLTYNKTFRMLKKK